MSLPPQVTLEGFLNAARRSTKNFPGDTFFNYDAFANNCQNFTLGLLRANGLDLSARSKLAGLYAFVYQDTAALAGEVPSCACIGGLG